MDTYVVLFILLAITGGSIGVARYSIEEDEANRKENNHNQLLAHFVLNAAIAVVGGVFTKVTISSNLEIVLAGGLVSSLIGYSQVRKILYDAILKKYQKTINNGNKSN